MNKFLMIFAICVMSGSVFGKDVKLEPVTVVFDIEAKGIRFGKDMLSRLSEYLSACFSESGHRVVLREEMLEKMKGKGACRDHDCRVLVADDLDANLILSAKILKFSGVCKLVATMLSPEQSIPLKVASSGASCKEKDLVAAVEAVAEEFAVLPGQKRTPALEAACVEELETVMMDFTKVNTGGNNGWLSVNSYPWGRVWIDGKDIGRYTPLFRYELPAGRYMITVRSPWNNTASTPVEIWPDEVTKLRLLFSIKEPSTKCQSAKPEPWGL